MTISELLLPEWDNEIRVTREVLSRVPDDRGEWKPHPKGFPLGHLAQLVARMPSWTQMMLTQTEFDVAPKGGKGFPGYSMEKTAALLELFDGNAMTGRQAIAGMDDAAFQVPWTLKNAGVTISVQSRYQMLRWMLLNHLVHHRAQLGLYLRMTDQVVPQMYGPTADDKK